MPDSVFAIFGDPEVYGKHVAISQPRAVMQARVP
jgi:hypothetical protein